MAITAVLGACSSNSAETTDTVATVLESTTSVAATTTTVSTAIAALPYFEALAKQTRVGYDAAVKMSTGPAKEYAKYMNESLQAVEFARADGQTLGAGPLQTATVDESGRIIVESEDNRIVYSNFQFSDGFLIGFDVEGRPLYRNLESSIPSPDCFTASYNDCAADMSEEVRILHAYVTAAGDLYLTYEIDSKGSSSIREDRASNGLPTHFVVDSAKYEVIKTKGAVETFAKGETRTNVVAFGPLPAGGSFQAFLNFRRSGSLYRYSASLGVFLG